jgi:membrane protease subunit (stomatin/prohibitin family)
MGLIKAIAGATGGVLADQWREFIYCESMPADVLVAKGVKRESRRGSNKKGDENIISNGSIIAVNEGQCMIILEQGKIVDFCAEPGEYVYDMSTEPSLFYGDLMQGIVDTFKQIGKRFTFGGETGKDQRVYYFNTKEIVGNKYGTPAPVPFRVIDRNIGLDIDISIRCHGEYSYIIADPLKFYANVTGNVEDVFTRIASTASSSPN